MRVPAQLRGGTFLGNEYFILATWLSLSWFNCRIGITMAGLKTTPKTLLKKAEMDVSRRDENIDKKTDYKFDSAG